MDNTNYAHTPYYKISLLLYGVAINIAIFCILKIPWMIMNFDLMI